MGIENSIVEVKILLIVFIYKESIDLRKRYIVNKTKHNDNLNNVVES